MSSATISFGLVAIPVKLYPATQPAGGVTFNLLHAKDGARLRQQYVCSKDGERVDRDEMVKGFELAREQYVTFSPEELRALEEEPSRAITIAEFVPLERVDPLYFDKAYYLGPEPGAEKAYRLLAEALQRSGKGALARYHAHGKQHLVLLRPREGRLVMQQLLYADEVRSLPEMPEGEPPLEEPEVQLALQLVNRASAESFHPEAYRDEARLRLREAVERKRLGQRMAPPPAAAEPSPIVDLLEALKASLAAAVPPGPGAARPLESRKPPQRARREGEQREEKPPHARRPKR